VNAHRTLDRGRARRDARPLNETHRRNRRGDRTRDGKWNRGGRTEQRGGSRRDRRHRRWNIEAAVAKGRGQNPMLIPVRSAPAIRSGSTRSVRSVGHRHRGNGGSGGGRRRRRRLVHQTHSPTANTSAAAAMPAEAQIACGASARIADPLIRPRSRADPGASSHSGQSATWLLTARDRLRRAFQFTKAASNRRHVIACIGRAGQLEPPRFGEALARALPAGEGQAGDTPEVIARLE
jgi:hypothetical protein